MHRGLHDPLRIEAMLPFTLDQFLGVFAAYNAAIWRSRCHSSSSTTAATMPPGQQRASSPP